MTDIRKRERRTQILSLKLTPEEHEGLRRLADANWRTPGDQVRFLIAKAIATDVKLPTPTSNPGVA